MLQIREIPPVEIPILRRIAIETQVETFAALNTRENLEAFIRDAYSMEKFVEEFQEMDSTYYMAWEGSEPAGFLRLRVNNEVEPHLGKHSIEIQRLYVTTAFQGKKVGAALMQHALNYGKDRKFEWMWLGVWEKNYKAQAFYKRWGFEKFAEHVFWMGPDPQNDWLLRLRLRSA